MLSHCITVCFAFTISLLSSGLHAGDEALKFPLIGLWSAISEEKDGKKIPLASEGTEIEFRPDGAMIVTAKLRGIGKLLRMHYSYSFNPPNLITYTIDGKEYEKQQFKVEGATLTLEDAFRKKSILRRILLTGLTDGP